MPVGGGTLNTGATVTSPMPKTTPTASLPSGSSTPLLIFLKPNPFADGEELGAVAMACVGASIPRKKMDSERRWWVVGVVGRVGLVLVRGIDGRRRIAAVGLSTVIENSYPQRSGDGRRMMYSRRGEGMAGARHTPGGAREGSTSSAPLAARRGSASMGAHSLPLGNSRWWGVRASTT
jgi:hypothetical protein